MSSISIAGDTSGSVIIAAPAVAGSTTLTLPTTSGTILTTTSGQWITSGSNIYYNTGNVGIGTTGPGVRTLAVVSATDKSTVGVFSGASYGVRIGTIAAVGGVIEGVDTTGISSYQPLVVGGSQVQFTTSGAERMRIASNGSREFSDSLGGIQYGEGTASWANVSSIAINLATVFPNISFTSKAISVQMQTLTNSSATAATTQLTLLLRRSDSTWATATSVANITSGGTTISAAGSGTTVTLTFGIGGQYGLTRINILTQA